MARQVGHLVEKQRSPVGLLELAATAADAGRGALLDAEELGLDERFDERGAVDGDERPAAPGAELVNLMRDELLADPALALEQHGEIGLRDALDPVAAAPESAASIR